MRPKRILVTGGAGFVGRATLDALIRLPCWDSLRLLVHERAPSLPPEDVIEHVEADLGEPASLRGVCEGVDVVLHLASHVNDDELCWAVNARGTEALVEAARQAGVSRTIYLSTAAVYGYAIHRGADEDGVVVSPATRLSRSRERAEQAVLSAGGTVVRPLFVYGNGDTRFVPVVLRGLQRLPFLVSGGKAKLSVIAVDDLAGALAALVLLDRERQVAGAYHATDGQPISFRDLALNVAQTVDCRVPRWSVPYAVARLLLRAAGSSAVGLKHWSPSAAHRLFLVTHDHYYDSSRLWRAIGMQPGAPFSVRIADFSDWYSRFTPASNVEHAP